MIQQVYKGTSALAFNGLREALQANVNQLLLSNIVEIGDWHLIWGMVAST